MHLGVLGESGSEEVELLGGEGVASWKLQRENVSTGSRSARLAHAHHQRDIACSVN